MRLKSTLWALAFACAAVSCSDDLENGPGNGTNNPDENGTKAYLSVNIATGGSATTKANGEEGDGYLEEITGLKEDKVYDINIFLFEKKDGETDGLAALNTAAATTTPIAGYGYLDGINGTPSGGNEPNHDLVAVTLKDPIENETQKAYWVLAIVNHGSKITGTDYANLEALREALSNKAWTGGATGIASYDKFVMSTHKMDGDVANESSVVLLAQANKDPDNPAETTVYVERLAARVDLQVNETLTSNNRTDGTFEITRYLPINLWKDNTYMFKQVSPKVTKIDDLLPAADATYGSGECQWLGDEIWTNTTDTKEFNYVLSVDMRNKTKDNFNSFTTKYDNYFYKEDVSADNLPYATTDNAWRNTSELANATYQSGDFTPIFYTRENTMDGGEAQMNGYSTGLIFESQFTFNENATVSSYNPTSGSVEAAKLPEANKGTFYVARHHGNVNFDGIKSIAATAFKELAETGEDYKVTADLMKGFMDGNWPEGVELAKIKTIVDLMSADNGVEKGFKAYLQGVLTNATDFEATKSQLSYASFIASDSYKDLAAPASGITDAYIATLYEKYSVSCYKEGKSYHKYWIQHDPSATPDARKDGVLGVMEYGIVRNNVYQLKVSGVKNLGDPLPFTPGKDDPETPDEKEDEYTINVEIYVKDWVLRQNQDIIL